MANVVMMVDNGTAPTLTLRLDADNNYESNGEDDSPTYVPGTQFPNNGLSVPVQPEGTPLQTLRLIAEFRNGTQVIPPPDGVTHIDFSLVETSAFKGYAMNAGNLSDPDFALVDTQAAFVNHRAIARLDVFDYGGFTDAKASFSSGVGNPNAQLKVPRDQTGMMNWIPDAGWHATANGEVISDLIADPGTLAFRDADDDLNPAGIGVPGDGLVNFEEYRGFIVRDEHRRTNPAVKDLFIDSTVGTGTLDLNIGYATSLPVTKHWVRPSELSTHSDPMNRATFLINANYENSGAGGLGAHSDQRGIRVREQAFEHSGLFGRTPLGCITQGGGGCTPNYDPPPDKPVAPASIFVQAIREESPDNVGTFLPEPTDVPGIMVVTAHEIGHMVNLRHYDFTPGGPVTVMISGFYPWANSTWTNLPTHYDELDLANLRVR